MTVLNISIPSEDERGNKKSFLDDAIVSVLKSTVTSIYPRELARRVCTGVHVPEYKILSCIRDMLKDGRLVLINGKIPGQCRTEEIFSVSKRKENVDTVQPGGERNWNFFRKLIHYYIKCIQTEDGFSTVAWQDRLGEDFIYLQRRGNWYPEPDKPWQTFIPLSDDFQNIRRLWREGGADLMLGYPVSASFKVQVGDITSARIVPVFCYPLEYSLSASGLELRTVRTEPVINLDWLKHAFPHRSAQERFLDLCGLPGALMGRCRNTFCSTPDLGNLAGILSRFFPERIREPLNPRTVTRHPIPEPFENGIYNKAMLITGKRTAYTSRLIAELKEISRAPDEELDRTALKYFFLNVQKEETLLPEGKVADVFPVNAVQRRAVASLLSSPVTVIQGPPGTGKSQVVAVAAANARLHGQTVLISSRNHKAVDAVMAKLTLPEGKTLAVRANSRQAPAIKYTLAMALKDQLGEAVDERARRAYEQLYNELNMRLEERHDHCETARILEEGAVRMGRLEEQLRHLETMLPAECCDRADGILGRFSMQRLRNAESFSRELSSLNGRLLSLFLTHPRRGYDFFRCVRAWSDKGWGRMPAWMRREPEEMLKRLAGQCLLAREYEETRQKIREERVLLEQLGTSLEDVEKALDEVEHLIQNMLPRLFELDAKRRMGILQEDKRAVLAGLRNSLLVRGNGLEAGLLTAAHAREALYGSPVWAVTSLSVGAYLPLAPAMFDMAFIDEAGQASIPSAIPVLFRAKRAGIIGDPRQLSAVSSITPELDTVLMQEFQLDVHADLRFSSSGNSLYDFSAGVPAATSFLLNETFRSASDIAEYSNDLFYQGRLSVATSEDHLHVPAGHKAGMEWSVVAGEVRAAPGGGVYCDEEVSETAALLRSLIRFARFDGTIGIVTPFRAQADRLKDMIYERSGFSLEELEGVQLHIDTAHGFQGDERDVMILSLCSGPDMKSGALHFLRENANLFNVAVSRARGLLHIVGNREWALHCSIPHIEALARPSAERRVKASGTKWYPHESPYEAYFYECLLKAGIRTIPQLPVRNRRLDLALTDDANPLCKLDIEIDGACHCAADGTRRTDDHWRDRQLRELGWRVVRFWTYELREDTDRCVARVRHIWEEMHAEQRDMKR